MNLNNDQGFPQMSETEIKSHKKIFSSLSFYFLAYLVLVQVLAIGASFLLQDLLKNVDLELLDWGPFNFLLKKGNIKIILSAVLQYCIAFPVLCLLVRRVPKQQSVCEKVSAATVLKYMLVGMFIMYVGNMISQTLMLRLESLFGGEIENSISTLLTQSDWYISVVFVGIIGPVVEELMFRKLFIDRLTPYGNVIAILFPSLIFGLFHGNLYQFFYAFALGAIFSYIYVKTGKIIYSILLHMFINIFCGVLPSAIMSMMDYDAFLEMAESGNVDFAFLINNIIPFALLMLYELAMFAMIIAGLVILIRNIKKIKLERGSVSIPKGRAGEVIFFNAGTVALIAVCLLIIALNTIPLPQ